MMVLRGIFLARRGTPRPHDEQALRTCDLQGPIGRGYRVKLYRNLLDVCKSKLC